MHGTGGAVEPAGRPASNGEAELAHQPHRSESEATSASSPQLFLLPGPGMVHPRAMGPPVAVIGIALDDLEALDLSLLHNAIFEQPARDLCRGVQDSLTGAATSVGEAFLLVSY